MAKIFISYRREDSQYQADRLHAALRPHVDDPNRDIFIDIDNIPLGVNFAAFLDEKVSQCEVLLVLIGQNWLDARNASGERRLDDPNDFVRIEIASALKRDIPVIPILFDGAPVPRPDQLPEEIGELSLRNGVEVRRITFEDDTNRLIRGLGLGSGGAPAKPQSGSAPGLKPPSPGSDAYWVKIEDTVEPRNYAAFTQHFPDHPRAFEANRRAGQLEAWQRVDKTSAEAIAEFRRDARNKDPLFPALETHTRKEMDRAARRNFEAGKAAASQHQDKARERWLIGGTVAAAVLAVAVGEFFPFDQFVTASSETTAAIEPEAVNQLTSDGSGVQPSEQAKQFQAGEEFRECDQCPEMVAVPTGSFTMGSPPSEVGRDDDEGPQRTVRIGYQFAVGKFEMAWAEWEACVADGGCSNSRPNREGGDESWGKGNRPVINVSWNDAQAYVQWLSRETGEDYRLLSEAEWEYVARAGTTSRFSWGDADPTCSRGARNGANFASCTNRRTEPVGFSAANAFGLHDLQGNVLEWVEDCYVDNYSGAATDGSAPIVKDCSQRVIRGGSWASKPLGSAARARADPTDRYNFIGFRVARTL